LAGLTDSAIDCEKISIAKEADTINRSTLFGKELGTVQSVRIMKDDKEVIYDLKILNVDQLRQLCKNVGMINCGNNTKFWCRVLIANYFTYKKSLSEQGLSHQTQEKQTTSTILCAVNVIFSDDFIIYFLAINNHKSRVDHEMGTTHKDFYICACDAHNASDAISVDSSDDKNADNSNYTLLIYPSGDKYLSDLENQEGINLCSVDQFTVETFLKKLWILFQSENSSNQTWAFQDSTTETHGILSSVLSPLLTLKV
jgi:hypothetical protein